MDHFLVIYRSIKTEGDGVRDGSFGICAARIARNADLFTGPVTQPRSFVSDLYIRWLGRSSFRARDCVGDDPFVERLGEVHFFSVPWRA